MPTTSIRMLNKPEYALILHAGISRCRELLNQLTIVKQDRSQRPERRPVYRPDFTEGFMSDLIFGKCHCRNKFAPSGIKMQEKGGGERMDFGNYT